MNHTRLYRLAACAILTALLCTLSPMTIPIGPIPISPAIFVVCLSSYLLGGKYAMLSVAAYLLLGMAGLPVFSGYAGGLAKLAGPTGGFLAGYLPTALIGGLAAEKSGWRTLPTALGLGFGVLAAYALGTVWFLISTGASLSYALSVCVLPFIPIDLGKIAAAMLLGKALRKALSKAGLLP